MTSTENWTATKAKALLKAVHAGASIHEIGLDMGVDSLVLLRILCLDGVFDAQCYSEEQSEFFALAMDGVPVIEAIRWCQADPGRLSCEALNDLRMGLGLNEGFDLARRHQLVLPDSLCLDELCSLTSFPDCVLKAAVSSLVERFELPTPSLVHAEISAPSQEGPVLNLNPSRTDARCSTGVKRAYKRTRRRAAPTTTTYTRRRYSPRRRRSYA